MTTTDARKRLTESINRLERTRTHSIDPDTGQFTRLDQEADMTDQPEPYDFHDEAERALLNDNLAPGEQASLHALLAIHDALTEIRDRLPERMAECCTGCGDTTDEALCSSCDAMRHMSDPETEPEGITCMTCGASLEAGDPLDCRKHAVPVPHPDDEADEALADWRIVARDNFDRAEKAEAERDRVTDRYDALREDVERHAKHHATNPHGIAFECFKNTLARDDARAEGQP